MAGFPAKGCGKRLDSFRGAATQRCSAPFFMKGRKVMENKEAPVASSAVIENPGPIKEIQPVTEATKLKEELPPAYKEENCIFIAGKPVEIKPTKLKYFRNKAASIYSVLKIVPLSEFLAYDKGIFDKERDSDQILLDFLVAVFDDEQLVRDNYNDMTAEDIEKVLEIFGRLNHINEKEEAARKNREAQAKH